MYRYLKNTNYNTWINYLFAILIIGVVVFFSTRLVNQLKNDEEIKVKSIAEALTLFGSEDVDNSDVISYLYNVTDQNTTIPYLILDESDSLVIFKNIDSAKIMNIEKRPNIIQGFKEFYPPIEIDLQYEKQFLYYKNSALLNQLEYYPYLVLLIIILFLMFTYWYFKTITQTEQSYLWAGLAKETAHQIGTPLSSIIGWIELLKLDRNDTSAVEEIENDVKRLQFITDRFSKIGSESDLKPISLNTTTQNAVEYLNKRISSKINIEIFYLENDIEIEINAPLFNWVLENLIKNAVDSLKNEGNIKIKLSIKDKWACIDVSDNGPGIAKNNKKAIFKPGFSTKKRGWGLGLSLAKRIIESYHKGKIFVLKSEPNKNTTFRILLLK